MTDKEILIPVYRESFKARKEALEAAQTTKSNTSEQLKLVTKYDKDAEEALESAQLGYNQLLEQIEAEGLTTEDLE